jgi:hypothetical protein
MAGREGYPMKPVSRSNSAECQPNFLECRVRAHDPTLELGDFRFWRIAPHIDDDRLISRIIEVERA